MQCTHSKNAPPPLPSPAYRTTRTPLGKKKNYLRSGNTLHFYFRPFAKTIATSAIPATTLAAIPIIAVLEAPCEFVAAFDPTVESSSMPSSSVGSFVDARSLRAGALDALVISIASCKLSSLLSNVERQGGTYIFFGTEYRNVSSFRGHNLALSLPI